MSDSWTAQQIYKMNLGHVVVKEMEEVIKKFHIDGAMSKEQKIQLKELLEVKIGKYLPQNK